MIRTRTLCRSLLLLALATSTARADGTVWMGWNNCTGPVNITTSPGTVLSACVWVEGQTQTAQSYQCVTTGQPFPHPVRDAWRFDPAGCNAGYFTLEHVAPAAVAKTCPSFQGQLASLQIKDYSYDNVGGVVKITVANAYPNGGAGNPAATNAATHYFLAGYVFDMTFGVNGAGSPPNTCGGLEVPMCFQLTSASWLDLAGNEINWAYGGQSRLSTNACFVPDPARTSTWGWIKDQYR